MWAAKLFVPAYCEVKITGGEMLEICLIHDDSPGGVYHTSGFLAIRSKEVVEPAIRPGKTRTSMVLSEGLSSKTEHIGW